jgi:hypothetical protein
VRIPRHFHAEVVEAKKRRFLLFFRGVNQSPCRGYSRRGGNTFRMRNLSRKSSQLQKAFRCVAWQLEIVEPRGVHATDSIKVPCCVSLNNAIRSGFPKHRPLQENLRNQMKHGRTAVGWAASIHQAQFYRVKCCIPFTYVHVPSPSLPTFPFPLLLSPAPFPPAAFPPAGAALALPILTNTNSIDSAHETCASWPLSFT